MKFVACLLLPLSLMLSAAQANAAEARFDAAIQTEDINLARGQHAVESRSIRLYVAITNAGSEDIEGLVRFFDNDQFIGGKVFSLRANNRAEDAWTLWTPKTAGEHTIRVEIANDAEFPDATPANNRAATIFVVHQDIDKDGIGDEYDDDMDGDGISNRQEEEAGTSMYKTDTDADGVHDGSDAYPLDPAQQQVPSPTQLSPAQKPTSTDVLTLTPPLKPTPTHTPLATLKKPAPSLQPSPTAQSTSSTPDSPTSTTPIDEPVLATTTVLEPAPMLNTSPSAPTPDPAPTIQRSAWHTQPATRALAAAAGFTATVGISALGISLFLRKPF